LEHYHKLNDRVDAARRCDRLLTFGFNMRFMAAAGAIYQEIQAGGLGRVHHTRCWSTGTTVPGWSVYHRKDKTGGGVLASCAAHAVDLGLWMLGFPQPDTALASAYHRIQEDSNMPVTWEGKREDCDVEDLLCGHVTLDEGKSVSVECIWSGELGDDIGIEVYGSNGSARLNVASSPSQIYQFAEDGGTIIRPVGPADWSVSLRQEMVEFIRCIHEAAEPRVTPEEAIRCQTVIDALYESTATGRPVSM
jgi:predicted dehydrogenase